MQLSKYFMRIKIIFLLELFNPALNGNCYYKLRTTILKDGFIL